MMIEQRLGDPKCHKVLKRGDFPQVWKQNQKNPPAGAPTSDELKQGNFRGRYLLFFCIVCIMNGDLREGNFNFKLVESLLYVLVHIKIDGPIVTCLAPYAELYGNGGG